MKASRSGSTNSPKSWVASWMDISRISVMEVSPIVTAFTHGLSRVPSHVLQGILTK